MNSSNTSSGSKGHGNQILPAPPLEHARPSRPPQRRTPWPRLASNSTRSQSVSGFSHASLVAYPLTAGKRTFGNIFNKVKAKMAEMDQPRQQNAATSSSAQQQQQPPWGVAGDTFPYETHHAPQQAAYYDPNPPPPVSNTTRPTPVQGYDLSPSSTRGMHRSLRRESSAVLISVIRARDYPQTSFH